MSTTATSPAPRDYEGLSRQLLRATRGRRSQLGLSRRLGYRTNVVYLWESGRRSPRASELFRIVAPKGRSPAELAGMFHVGPSVDLREPSGIAELVRRVAGTARVADVARRAGVSRYTASRWLSGVTEPRLSELLRLVDVLSLRLIDFVEALAPLGAVPELAREATELEARRRVAFAHPWTAAILRLVETEDYRALRAHRPGWIAARLGLDDGEETRCIAALEAAGLVRRNRQRYETTPAAVDTSRGTDEERRALKLHWVDAGRERLARGADGLFSWSVIAVSAADFERLRALHIEYMTQLRQIVDASSPSQVVALANVQLMPLVVGAQR